MSSLTFTAASFAALGAVPVLFLTAAEQSETQKCDPSGVCTVAADKPVAAGPKQMWASSRIFTDAPPLEVGKWLTEKPEMNGKFIVIEFWRTWCGACKRATPLLNQLQAKYGNELVVIGITGESEEAIRAYKGPKQAYFLALDLPQTNQTASGVQEQKTAGNSAANEPDQAASPSTVRPGQGRYEAMFNVWGWPHVIILEPQFRTIVWEGFPDLKGHELTEAKVEKILAIGRAAKEEANGKK